MRLAAGVVPSVDPVRGHPPTKAPTSADQTASPEPTAGRERFPPIEIYGDCAEQSSVARAGVPREISMSDRHETIVNVGRGVGLAVGVVVAVVLVGLVIFAVIKTTGTEAGPSSPNVIVQAPAPPTQPRIPGTPRAKSVVSTPASAASNRPLRHLPVLRARRGISGAPPIPESSG